MTVQRQSSTVKITVAVLFAIVVSVSISTGLFFSRQALLGNKPVAETEAQKTGATMNQAKPKGETESGGDNIWGKGKTSTEKPGKCPASDGFGITVHECSHDSECDGTKKCCAVGGGAGTICREPVLGNVTPAPTPVSTKRTSSLDPCPGADVVRTAVLEPCSVSMQLAMASRRDKCSHYAQFLKCASLVMRLSNYLCLEHELQEIMENHHWNFHTARTPSHGFDEPSASDYYGSGRSSWYGSDPYHYYGSGRSSWYNSDSSDYYGSSSSSWYGSYPSNYYWPGSSSWYSSYPSDYYGSGESSWYSSDPSDYYGSSRSSWYNSDSSNYYWPGSSSWYGSGSSDYYGSGSSSWYSSYPSDYYGSGSSSWYSSDPSDYYGSGESSWYSSDPSDYYGSGESSWYSSDPSDYYGSGESSWYSSDPSDYYGSGSSSWYSSDPSDYYGSGESSWYSSDPSDYYGSGESSWYNSDSSDYYGSRGSSWSGWGNSGSSAKYNRFGNSRVYSSYGDAMYRGSSDYYGSSAMYDASTRHHWNPHGGHSAHSLPFTCKDHRAPSLVDIETTELCANPDAYVYLLKYNCNDTVMSMSASRGPRSHHFSSGFTESSSASSDDACMAVAQKVQCLNSHFQDVGLVCTESAIYDTIKQHKHAVLTAEANTCFDTIQKLQKDKCYRAIISKGAPCLQGIHAISGRGKVCSMFKTVVNCIAQTYPERCGRKDASHVLLQGLSAELVLKNFSTSLRFDVKDIARQFYQCSKSKVVLTSDRNVLMQIDGKWFGVCSVGWDDLDAEVVCRSVGYKVGFAATGSYNANAGMNGRPTTTEESVLDMNCSGRENSLFDCSYKKGEYCPSDRKAKAVCYKSAPVYEIVSDKENAVYGYVKRTVGERSGFVMSAWTDERTIDLFCKAAGYRFGGIQYLRDVPNVHMGSMRWGGMLSCQPDDSSIENCDGSDQWIHGDVHEMYSHHSGLSPVKVFCYASGVRLHNSFLNSTGIAQVLKNRSSDTSPYHQQNLPVSRDDFDNFTASLFCQALGLGFESGIVLNYQPFLFQSNEYDFFRFSCRGWETKLSDCKNWTVTRGQLYQPVSSPASVQCAPGLGERVPDMTVKLDFNNRTVLVYRNNQWGYICNDHWTDAEAAKVCNLMKLDYGLAVSTATYNTYQPFLIHNVTCSGADQWEYCRYKDVTSDVCRDKSPAQVSCISKANLPVYSLYNGKDARPNYGWVRVRREGRTGRLCGHAGEEFYRVLCRELGFIDGEEYRAQLQEHRKKDLAVWNSAFYSCNADSSYLESCRDMDWMKGVLRAGEEGPTDYCSGGVLKAICYNDTVKVHSGYFNTSGVLEVAVSGEYRHVCAQRSGYTQQAADVVCRSLTHSPTSSAIMVRKNVFMFTSKARVQVNFSCDGTEENVDQCMTIINADAYYGDCQYAETMVAVVCYEGEKPTDGITDWMIDVQDSVLVKQFGLWGHVCSHNWTHNEAAAVCKSLGHDSGVSISAGAWGTWLAQWVSAMSCPPNAQDVSQCSVTMKDYTLPQGSDYSSCHAVRAKCFELSEVPSMFFVDNGTLGSSQGRVAVTYNGTTGYFCSPSVSTAEGYDTLCRLMGYPRGGEKLDPASTSLPEPVTYQTGWAAYMTCGFWDRNAHYISCIQEWNLQDIYDHQYDWYSHSLTSTLSQCGEHMLAISCIESEDYQLISSSKDRSEGLLVVWNQGNSAWEQVCRSGFSSAAANAACRQLGFSEGGKLTTQGTLDTWFYYNTGSVQYHCSGAAGETLSTCSTTTTTSCYEATAVWLKCQSV
ncbi:uncharacterized protein LOC143279415 [Babylonia areolata]|uniref:uncharacterized protein LOC143279415 n=1 Tax=Babylonia areolata TaxID=304850 RepID=UPI003FD5EA3F